jgi:hypothetical protein
MTPLFKELDTVVLLRDVPAAGLRQGDLGAVVQVYPVSDVRPVGENDLLAVRTAPPVQGAA